MHRDSKLGSLMSVVSLAALAVGLIPLSASAAVDYRYSTDVTALTVAPGEERTVSLYLIETVTGASTSRLVAESGLSSASVRVQASSALANPSMVRVMTANTAEFNDIAGPEESVSPTFDSGLIREYLDIAAPVGPTGTDLGGGVRQVFLGTVTVRGGSSDGITTFSVTDIPVTNDTVTVDNFASPLDALIAPASFSVTVLVPEPVTPATVGLLATSLLVRRRRLAR